ncbi:glycosyltransferase [Lactobacillus johnsonii]|uniref:glycosyltransferase n=1 Tax=Lactobacillus johnsonii TaxID=33959 RepID=UPI0013031F54|nr:glycosyltransferase [Lactobacillus johnsonii]QGY96788.1 glycosyltransferase [Lactobacillus johnsonii]
MAISNEKVSIIVPIYNAEKYLEECIESVTKQTYKDLQIILVNDGSKDKSWELCKKLKNSDSRIVIATQSNAGVSVARNKGLDLADGKWIMFVDPDDVLSKTIVEDLLTQVSAEIDIVACGCYGFDGSYRKKDSFFKGNRIFKANKDDLYLQLMDASHGQGNDFVTAIGVPWGKIYRHNFIKKYNLRFDPKLRRMQDNIFNMYAFYYAREIFYLDKPLYFYRLDHITDYNKRHQKDMLKIFKPVVDARTTAISTLGLNKDPQIYKFYLQETAGFFFGIVNSLILTNKRFEKEVKQLKNNTNFNILFKNQNIKKIKDKKMRYKLFLFDHNLIRLYSIMYKILGKN